MLVPEVEDDGGTVEELPAGVTPPDAEAPALEPEVLDVGGVMEELPAGVTTLDAEVLGVEPLVAGPVPGTFPADVPAAEEVPFFDPHLLTLLV